MTLMTELELRLECLRQALSCVSDAGGALEMAARFYSFTSGGLATEVDDGQATRFHWDKAAWATKVDVAELCETVSAAIRAWKHFLFEFRHWGPLITEERISKLGEANEACRRALAKVRDEPEVAC
jgi:hypothetical protein